MVWGHSTAWQLVSSSKFYEAAQNVFILSGSKNGVRSSFSTLFGFDGEFFATRFFHTIPDVLFSLRWQILLLFSFFIFPTKLSRFIALNQFTLPSCFSLLPLSFYFLPVANFPGTLSMRRMRNVSSKNKKNIFSSII